MKPYNLHTVFRRFEYGRVAAIPISAFYYISVDRNIRIIKETKEIVEPVDIGKSRRGNVKIIKSYSRKGWLALINAERILFPAFQKDMVTVIEGNKRYPHYLLKLDDHVLLNIKGYDKTEKFIHFDSTFAKEINPQDIERYLEKYPDVRDNGDLENDLTIYIEGNSEKSSLNPEKSIVI